MATFYVTVSSVYSVEIAESFIDEHKGNHGVISDEIADVFFAGECSLIDEQVVDFEPADQPVGLLSF